MTRQWRGAGARAAAWGALAASVSLGLCAPPAVAAATASGVRAAAVVQGVWTAERMRQARPLPLPTPSRDRGRPSVPAAPQTAVAAEPEPPGPAYDYPPPYSRWEAYPVLYDRAPLRAVGKLFFVQGGADYVCSAVSVGGDAIMTAGHCVHRGDGSPDGWSTDLVFIPAYRDGRAPYGWWRGASVRTTAAWYADGDFRHDLGGVILGRRRGRSISAAVGAVPPVFHLDPRQHWTAASYPQGPPFTGRRLVVCSGSWSLSDTGFPSGPYPVGMGCDATEGASGGPWIVDFRTGSALNGVFSYRTDPVSRGEEAFSPYFGAEAEALFRELLGPQP